MILCEFLGRLDEVNIGTSILTRPETRKGAQAAFSAPKNKKPRGAGHFWGRVRLRPSAAGSAGFRKAKTSAFTSSPHESRAGGFLRPQK
jgi:hypothetical protein